MSDEGKVELPATCEQGGDGFYYVWPVDRPEGGAVGIGESAEEAWRKAYAYSAATAANEKELREATEARVIREVLRTVSLEAFEKQVARAEAALARVSALEAEVRKVWNEYSGFQGETGRIFNKHHAKIAALEAEVERLSGRSKAGEEAAEIHARIIRELRKELGK